MKILKYGQFKINENTDITALLKKKADLQKQMTDLQKQSLAIDQQVISAQQNNLINQPDAAPIIPMPQVTQPVQENGDFDQSNKPNILDFGFEGNEFWIGLTDDVENDMTISDIDFISFVEGWASKFMNREDLDQYHSIENEDMDDENMSTKYNAFNGKRFFDEQDYQTQKDIVTEYVKSHPKV